MCPPTAPGGRLAREPCPRVGRFVLGHGSLLGCQRYACGGAWRLVRGKPVCPYSEPPEDGPAFSAEDSGESLRARSDARALHASKASSDEINASSVSGHVDEVLFASADDLVGSEGGRLLSDITLTMSRGVALVNFPRARRGVRTRRASPSLRLHHREVGAGEEPAPSPLPPATRRGSPVPAKVAHALPEAEVAPTKDAMGVTRQPCGFSRCAVGTKPGDSKAPGL